MPESLYRFRDRLPAKGEGKQPRNELAASIGNDGVARMYLYDVIDSWGGFWGVSSSEFADALAALPADVDTIHLHVNSPGGEVYEGIAIKNLLAQHSARVVAVVDGLAASAASFIAVAADEVVMGENTELMIHDASAIARGNAQDFRSWAEDLDRVSDNIAAMYAAKSGTSAAEWRDVMRAERWYSAQDAVDAGLADRVGVPDEQGDESAAASAGDELAALRAQQEAALTAIGAKGAPSIFREPGRVAAVAESTTRTTPEETTRQQTDTAPSATAETGAKSRSTDHTDALNRQKDDDMPSMSIAERKARIAEIEARLRDINAANEGDMLSETDRSEWDALFTEKGEHEDTITDIRKRTAQLEAAARNDAAAESETNTEQRTRSVAPAFTKKPENVYDTVSLRQNARNIDELKKGYRDNAMRAIESAKFPSADSFGSDRAKVQARLEGMLNRELNDENDNTSALAARILNSGSPTYNHAFGKAFTAAARFNPNPLAGLSPTEVQALTLGSDTDGGYAVPFELDPTVILTSAGSSNPMRQLARVVEITGKKWEGLTSAGSTATRTGETDEAALGNPVFGQPTVDTSRVDVFVDFSIALESSWAELSPELSMVISEALVDEEAASFITGAGTALTSGGTLPQGILTGLSATTTSYVVTASTGAMVLADLRGVKSALPERFRNGTTSWIAADTFYDQADALANTVTVSDVRTVGVGDQLLGKPKYEASGMPDYSSTSGTNLAIYGNISRAYVIVDRIGFNLALIPFLTGSNGRPNGKRGLWGYRYNGAKLIVPGAARLLRMK